MIGTHGPPQEDSGGHEGEASQQTGRAAYAVGHLGRTDGGEGFLVCGKVGVRHQAGWDGYGRRQGGQQQEDPGGAIVGYQF